MLKYRYVNVIKGIGILAVVIGHQGLGGEIHRFIYSFHMALFFILYGFLFRPYSADLLPYLMKKAQILLGAYFKAAIWSVLFFLIVLKLGSESVGVADISSKVLDYARGSAHGGALEPNGPLWFLVAYFFFNLYFQILYFVQGKIGWAAHIWGGAFLLASYLTFSPFWFSVDAAILAVPFFYGGVVYRKVFTWCSKLSLAVLLTSFLFVIVFFLIFLLGQSYDVSVSEVGFYLDFVFLGLLFFLPVLCTAIYLEDVAVGRALAYLGENSLLIMCYHILMNTAATYVLSVLTGWNYDMLRENFVNVAVMVFVYPFLLAWVLSKRFFRRVF